MIFFYIFVDPITTKDPILFRNKVEKKYILFYTIYNPCINNNKHILQVFL